MKTLLASRSTSERSSTGQAILGRAGRLVATLICALATWALLAPASAAAATTCPVQGLTIHAGKVGVDVVGLSAQGVPCQRAVGVARQVAHSLAVGSSVNLAGSAGIAVATTTPCDKCATQTHVSLSYPAGTIKMTLKGATKLFARAGSVIPTITIPRIPWFQFPSFPRLPTIPNFPSPANATTATICPVHGLTIHAGKGGVDVVGLSAQGVPCQKAVGVARQVAHGLAVGSSLNLAGSAGIAVSTTTPCDKCATQTHVTLSYPTGTIKMTLNGATKLFARAGAAIPFPTIPFPRIPGFQFPSFRRFPNIPNFPSPVPSNGTTTV